MAIDYRALIRDRQDKQTRPLVRHEVCLLPELYAELEEAHELVDAAEVDAYDADGNALDARAGGGAPPEVHQARLVVQSVEKRMAEASVTMVFKAPTADRMADYHDAVAQRRADDPGTANRAIIELSRPLILDCFDHAEGPAREKLDLTRADFEPVVSEWTHGEIVVLGNKLQSASVGAPDLPKSALSSLRNRPSGATSKQR